MPKNMREDDEIEDYEVGYGRPPKGGQFRKGVSGNPLGRPKRAPDLESEMVRQANLKVPVQERGKRRMLTKYQVKAMQLVNRAATGSFRETLLLTALLPQALQRVAELSRTGDADDLSDDELAAIIRGEN